MSGKILVVFLLLLHVTASATPEISMEVFRYQSDDQPLVEVAVYVAGHSLDVDSLNKTPYGIEYVLLIQSNAQNVIAGNRYRLTSPDYPVRDIMDVKRFALDPGTYTVTLEASDIRDPQRTIAIEQTIEIMDPGSRPVISDLQLLSAITPEREGSSLNKSGKHMELLPFGFYYPALSQLYLYHEVYHADQLAGSPYVQYTLKPATADVPASIVVYKKLKKQKVEAVVIQLDISELISGQYLMEAQLFDGQKELQFTTEVSLTRLNPVGDSIYIQTAPLKLEDSFVQSIPADSLDYIMRAMAPIVNSIDNSVMNTLLHKGQERAKRFFIYRYWTNGYGTLAGIAFVDYMKVAKAVDVNFASGFGYGFETDRGHIFLKYGRPDDVQAVEDEPSAPPYEIWFYTTFPATHQQNVRFLFYNPSLAKNDYRLLHSTAIGELRNDRWEIELYKDATLETPAVGEKVMGENVHRNARRYFEN
jgi:GWxTD domain-containing protein